MRYLILLIATAFLSSCEVLNLLLEDHGNAEAVKLLHLEYTSTVGLLGNINATGTIRNIGTQTISDIELKATVLHPDKTYDITIIRIPQTLTKDTQCTFTEKVAAEFGDELILEIKAAQLGY